MSQRLEVNEESLILQKPSKIIDRLSVFWGYIEQEFRILREGINSLLIANLNNDSDIRFVYQEAPFNEILKEYRRVFPRLCLQEGINLTEEEDYRLGDSFFYDCRSLEVDPEELYKYFDRFLKFLKNETYDVLFNDFIHDKNFHRCAFAMIIGEKYIKSGRVLEPKAYFESLDLKIIKEEFYRFED